ncbi:MAG: DinB family protein [Caldilineaceae bacterium]|nr:DinB family protein [Caldilineaceae bacterium]HRJ41332.1 DinB family protein [Caldilineaceae bacterium]
MTPKTDFLTGLRSHIHQHAAEVQSVFLELDDTQLTWRPRPGEWNILQCFDHLNLTHDYYAPKVADGLAQRRPALPAADSYAPSFWGRIYMHFSFNPKYSFPTVPAITPGADNLGRDVLHRYLAKQEGLLATLDAVASLDLRATTVPIEKFVRFNLGDCLKILVYHDQLHIGQAQRVLQTFQEKSA